MHRSKHPTCPPNSQHQPTTPAHPAGRPSTPSNVAEPGDNAPCWLPRGDAWRRLSEPIRHAVHQRILPMWKQLVDGAADELERSAAATLVYLTWLEIREQIELEEARGDSDPLCPSLVDPERLLARHLQLLTAKQRHSELFAKLRFAREKSSCRQSAAPNQHSSILFGNPLGPLRCHRSAPSDTVQDSRPSQRNAPLPDDAEDQPAQPSMT